MRQVIKESRAICQQNQAKIRFVRLKSSQAGYCDYENSSIYINSSIKDRNYILSVLFHELAHLECFRTYKWKNYHRAEFLHEQINTALKAEKWCDRWAEMELYKYDKRIRYVKSYSGSNKELKKFLTEFFETELENSQN